MQPTRLTVSAAKQRKRITFDDEDTIATMLEFSPGKAQVGKLVFYLWPTRADFDHQYTIVKQVCASVGNNSTNDIHAIFTSCET